MIISFLNDGTLVKKEKITVLFNGRTVTFSEEMLGDIFEKNPRKEIWKDQAVLESGEMILVLDNKEYYFCKDDLCKFLEKEKFDLAERKDKVNYSSINKELFKTKKSNSRQEELRQVILKAFEKADQNPEKYAKVFFVVIPKNTWAPKCKLTKEIVEVAYNWGDHMADWVELALGWAQRISDGESWEKICSKPDTSKYFRVFEENGKVRFVGGSCLYDFPISEFDFGEYCEITYKLYNTVPLIIQYQ